MTFLNYFTYNVKINTELILNKNVEFIPIDAKAYFRITFDFLKYLMDPQR